MNSGEWRCIKLDQMFIFEEWYQLKNNNGIGNLMQAVLMIMPYEQQLAH